jgi:hypothetical protein
MGKVLISLNSSVAVAPGWSSEDEPYTTCATIETEVPNVLDQESNISLRIVAGSWQ